MPCGMREEVRAVPGLRVGAGCGVSQDRGEDVAQQLAAAVSAGLGGVQVDLLLDGAPIERNHPAAPLAAQPREPPAAIGERSELGDDLHPRTTR